MAGDADRLRALRVQPALQLVAEEQVGELALPVGGPLAVAAPPVQVVPVHAADPVHGAAQVHHPRPGRRQQRGQQPAGEREVAEVIGAELHLEAVHGLAAGQRHHPGVVDQAVQDFVLRQERRGEGAHRGEAREVERHRGDVRARAVGAEALDRRAGLLGVAAGDQHARAVARELAGRLVAEPAVAAGHDQGLAGEVRDLVRVPGRRGHAHPSRPIIHLSRRRRGRLWVRSTSC